ncbi:hypothetical protein RJ639_021039 [Escallonia herrerae]|uniref:K Homology domain-containing protein n=1 Tax=Escallonia herrerae TaxID=1293975 RepID=A0AA89AFY4_9ASTE|nr:hypothetical protein RJ639_021039 [Escallonia herrerae]
MASTEPSENGSAQTPKIDPQTAPSDSADTTAENPPAQAEAAAAAAETAEAEKRWPGWPGDCVYRVIVPVLKVGSIIGRKGELIKKMCEESRARIRVLDGPVGAPDRIKFFWGECGGVVNKIAPPRFVGAAVSLCLHLSHSSLVVLLLLNLSPSYGIDDVVGTHPQEE